MSAGNEKKMGKTVKKGPRVKTWGALCDSQVPRRCQCARLTLSHSSLQTVMMMMMRMMIIILMIMIICMIKIDKLDKSGNAT